MTARSLAAMSRMTCACEMKMDSDSGRYCPEKKPLEYAAEAAAYVQTPAAIVEQARAVQDRAAENSFSISLSLLK